MDLISAIAVFVAGLAFGSFLNVCISRIPRDLSIVTPRSHCQQCKAPISWGDNIPVLSWIWLKGRCRNCGHRISPRYLIVEVITAALFLASYFCFGLGWMTLKVCIFCFLIVGLIFMDAETGLLPAEFTYPGILLGLLSSLLVPGDASGLRFVLAAFERQFSTAPRWLSFLDALCAAILGAAVFYLAWAAYYLIRKRHGVGFGDIAMMAMIGAFLGLRLTVLVIFLAPVLGTLYAVLVLMGLQRHKATAGMDRPPNTGVLLREIPFGVFLGISSLVALFFGATIWAWYLGFFR